MLNLEKNRIVIVIIIIGHLVPLLAMSHVLLRSKTVAFLAKIEGHNSQAFPINSNRQNESFEE